MNKFKTISLVVITSFILIGCSYDSNRMGIDSYTNSMGGRFTSILTLKDQAYEAVVIKKDNETGCEYIEHYYDKGVGMSPLYDIDGKVKGCGKK